MPSNKTISGNCVNCGSWRYSLHRDHIVPKFKGGPDTAENIQLLCANCHEDKTRADFLGVKRDSSTWPNFAMARARMSLAARNRVVSEETRAKLSLAAKGRKLSIEHVEAIRRGVTGIPKTEEQKAKQRAAMAGRSPSNKGIRTPGSRRWLRDQKRTAA